MCKENVPTCLCGVRADLWGQVSNSRLLLPTAPESTHLCLCYVLALITRITLDPNILDNSNDRNNSTLDQYGCIGLLGFWYLDTCMFLYLIVRIIISIIICIIFFSVFFSSTVSLAKRMLCVLHPSV